MSLDRIKAPTVTLRFRAVRARFTRGRLLRVAAGAAGAFGVLPGLAAARDTAPHAAEIAVRGAAKPFAGDRPMFTTIAPGVPGRDTASVLFRLERRARVRLDAVRTGIRTTSVRWTKEATLGPGAHQLAWRPTADTPVGSYVMQPGKQNHNDVCKSKTDCIIFIHQHAKGDFIPKQ